MKIASLEERTLKSLSNVIKSNRVKRLYVLFSGGRDSLVVLHLAYRVRKFLKVPIIAVYVSTTVATPGNLKYVKQVCNKYHIKLKVVKPYPNYFTLVKRWGFPTSHRRWCCYHLKIKPLKRYFGTQPRNGLIIDGIRRDESLKRHGFPKIDFHKHFKLLCYHPIFDWSKEDVLRYIEQHSLPENPLYQILPRAIDCWCTAFKSVKQFKLLKMYWPELFKKYVEAEAKLRSKGSALFKNGRRVYLSNL